MAGDDALVDRLMGGGGGSLVDRVLAESANIDRRTGAPAGVRAAVGAAATEQDRLATLRRTFPDARPAGDGNFVFTNPRTGRPTLYNPPGLDWGDAASLLPEAGEIVGGMAGGAAAVAGAPLTGGASLLTVPAGVGLGAAAGRRLVEGAARASGATVDSRNPVQVVADDVTTAGLNAVGVPIGNAIGRGVRAGLGAVTRPSGPATGAAALADFANARVPPSAGAVTGNRLTQNIELGLAHMPGGVDVVRDLAERQAVAAGAETARIARGLGAAADPAVTGRVVREGAEAAVRRFEDRQGQLYNEAYSLIDPRRPADLTNLRQYAAQIARDVADAPASRAATLRPALQRLERLLTDADASGGSIPFETLRAIRTDIGRVLGNPGNPASAVASDAEPALRGLYAALSDDMLATARAAGPDAERAITLADRYTRFNRTLNLPTLERVLRQGTDEQVYRLAFPESGTPDTQTLARITRNLTPQERGALSATVLDRMGRPTAGQNAGEDFSVSTFLTNWNRLTARGPGAANILFRDGVDPRLNEQLTGLVRVTQRLRDSQRLANPSGTARGTVIGALLLGSGQQLAQGDIAGAAGIAASVVIAPRMAARLLTNPTTVAWLARAGNAVAATGDIPPGVLASLGRIGAINAEIRPAVEALQEALSAPSAAAPMPSRQPAAAR